MKDGPKFITGDVVESKEVIQQPGVKEEQKEEKKEQKEEQKEEEDVKDGNTP